MAARRFSQPSDGSVFLGILGVLLIVGWIIQHIWWVIGAAVAAGIALAIVALVKEEQERRKLTEEQRQQSEDEAADREFELQRHAERQHRWMLMGDSRAIYGEGVTGPAGPEIADDSAAGPDPTIARMAATPAELAALIRNKPRGWEQALFASVMVQRVTPLATRLRDSELGFRSRLGFTRAAISREGSSTSSTRC